MISGSVATKFSSMIVNSKALKISVSAWTSVPVMISGSVGTQFSSMICVSNAVYGR